jgi:perosamine synthetase
MRQFRNLGIELIKGRLKSLIGRHEPAPLHGMTLDEDDAGIAKHWLMNRECWEDLTVVSAWESAFAEWNGSAHAFAFSAGRKALSACIYALELRADDEVIVPGYTCIVVQNAFDFAGVKTVHCDIELDTFGPDLTSVSECITPCTKAILVHHLYGLVCRDYEGILELAHRRGLRIIEDCAQATGAMFRGRRVGTYGDVAFYSSEWTKVYTTVVGGVAVTSDSTIAEKLAEFTSLCAWPDPDIVERQLRTAIIAFVQAKLPAKWWALPYIRFKYGREETVGMSQAEIQGRRPGDYFTRMPAPAAGLALNQLRKIDNYNESRRKTAAFWDSWCDKNGYRKPMILSDSIPVFLRYPVLVEPARKMDTTWARRELEINLGVWFKTHLHPSPRIVKDCPNADVAVAGCVNFPTLMYR